MRVLAVPDVGADYHEDLTALRSRYVPLPARYTAKPVTAGFYAVRQMAEAVSVAWSWMMPGSSALIAAGSIDMVYIKTPELVSVYN